MTPFDSVANKGPILGSNGKLMENVELIKTEFSHFSLAEEFQNRTF